MDVLEYEQRAYRRKNRNKRIGQILIFWGIASLLVLLVFSVGAITQSNSSKAQVAVESAGNTNVELGPMTYLPCGRGDVGGFNFKAMNANGDKVSGVVCCGLVKGCTVRY
jgi:hypothetical protein